MSTPTDYKSLVGLFIDIINIIIPTIFGALFVFFIWKVIDAWVINAGDEQKREAGRNYAIVAVIIFVVMVSVWGIVAMLRQSIFGN